MKVDLGLPLCNLKTCQYNKAGQCVKEKEYYNCPHTIAKLVMFKNLCENLWIDNTCPDECGYYKVLVLDTANDIVIETDANYDGTKFILPDYINLIAWKHL